MPCVWTWWGFHWDMSRTTWWSSRWRISGAGAHTLSPPSPMPPGTYGLENLRTLLVFELDAVPWAPITPTQDFINLGRCVMTTLGIGCFIRHWLLPGRQGTNYCAGCPETATGASHHCTPVMSVTGHVTPCLHMVARCILYVRPLTIHMLRIYVP